MNRNFFWVSASLVALVMVLLVAIGVLISGNRYRSITVADYGKVYYYGTQSEGTVYMPREKATYVASESALYYESGDVYRGAIQNYLPEGQGVYTTAAGEVYEGVFEKGKLEGYGKATLASGDVYEGEFLDGKWHGNGKLTLNYDNGREVIVGAFMNGRPEGDLTYLYRNGTTYVGGYRDGMPNGMGKLTFPNKDVYEGTFVNGELSGYGTYTYADGSVYSGEFVMSKPHGYGNYTYEENGVSRRVSGSFVSGVLVEPES